jgi:hypothetical protein
MNTSSVEFTTILTQAGSSLRADAKSMVSALQQAELTARRSSKASAFPAAVPNEMLTPDGRLTPTPTPTKSNISFADLAGEWRLCFVTGASKSKQKRGIKLGRGYYLPKFIFASITFTPHLLSNTEGTVANQLKFGGFQLKFTGPCRYPGKKNLLIFDFTQIQLDFLGRTIYQNKIRSGKLKESEMTVPISQDVPSPLVVAKMPFFAFFWAGKNEIAARGRGGGLALWVRHEDDA